MGYLLAPARLPPTSKKNGEGLFAEADFLSFVLLESLRSSLMFNLAIATENRGFYASKNGIWNVWKMVQLKYDESI